MDKEKLLKQIEYRIEEYLTYRYEPHSKVVLAELYDLHKWITEEWA